MTPAEKLIVRSWETIHENMAATIQPRHEAAADNDERYGPIDYATAELLDLSVGRVGDALVSAGKRPPVWWIG